LVHDSNDANGCYNSSEREKIKKMNTRDTTKLREFWLTYERRAKESKNEDTRKANALRASQLKEEYFDSLETV
jgi:hypothetical protein